MGVGSDFFVEYSRVSPRGLVMCGDGHDIGYGLTMGMGVVWGKPCNI